MKELTDIKDMHEVLYDGICYFDDFCKAHNLKYFLSNGTLLGAAKYNDFIPWDDDVDVIMPRESYDRLICMTEINNAQYKLLCKEQVNTWRMPYAKLSCEKTLVREGEYQFGSDFGLNIDIFPIDNWHPCYKIAKMQSVKMEILKRLLIFSNGKEFLTRRHGATRILLHSMFIIAKLLGHKHISGMIRYYVAKSKKYTTDYVGCVAWTCHMTNEVLHKSLFAETTELNILDRKFPTFVGYETYLDKLYGDWRSELPVDQQHSNHDIKVWWRNE